MTNPSTFLSVDWGTSTFRLRCVSLSDGRILAGQESDQGVKALSAPRGDAPDSDAREGRFHDYLAEEAAALLRKAGLPPCGAVIVSGMASSSLGWRELPYVSTPFALDGSQARTAKLRLSLPSGDTLPVLLVSGVATATDLMRGEECQVMGLLGMPRFRDLAEDAWVILPGTHSKHVRVRQGSLVDVQTHMTGELFEVLCHHSVLRMTTGASAVEPTSDAFAEGVNAAGQVGLARSLFQARTRALLRGTTPADNRSFLCGLLVGAECLSLAGQTKGEPLLLAAGSRLLPAYAMAARQAGLEASVIQASPAELDQALIACHLRWASALDMNTGSNAAPR